MSGLDGCVNSRIRQIVILFRTTGIVTSIKSKDVVEFYVENPFVKIKDE